MAYYTIGGSLMHYRTPGSKNGISNTPGYRAVGQRAKGRLINGRYVYDVAASGRLANSRPYGGSNASTSSRAKAANPARVSTSRPHGGSNISSSGRAAVARTHRPNASAIRSQFMSGVADDRRSSANTKQNVKDAYRMQMARGANRTSLDRPDSTWQDTVKGAYDAASQKAGAAYTYTTRKIRQTAKSTAAWGRQAMDWAGTKAREAFASVRSFISDILKRVGAAAKSVSRWAETTVKNAYNSAYTSLRKPIDSARSAVGNAYVSGRRAIDSAYTDVRNRANDVYTTVRKTGAKAFGSGPNNVADYYEKQARGAKKRRASSNYRPVR